MITLALVQTRPKFLDVEANWNVLADIIRSTEADIFVLPELALSGYTFSSTEEIASASITQHGDVMDEIRALSAERGVAICGGYAEAESKEKDKDKADGSGSGRFYNSAFLVADGTLLHNYRKTHLFFRETQFFTPGDSGFGVVEYRGVRLGVMICFDWIFPEAARTLALLGAQIILHPSNLVLPYCQKAMYARSIENRVYIATVNRVGRETNSHGDDLTFTGRSQLVSPFGEYLLELNETEEATRSVTVDPTVADNKRLNEFNTILADRRPEMYR